MLSKLQFHGIMELQIICRWMGNMCGFFATHVKNKNQGINRSFVQPPNQRWRWARQDPPKSQIKDFMSWTISEMHEFSGAAAYHHPGTAGTLPGVAGAPRDVVGGAVFENFRRYRSICLFKDAKNARTRDRFTPWQELTWCNVLSQNHFTTELIQILLLILLSQGRSP